MNHGQRLGGIAARNAHGVATGSVHYQVAGFESILADKQQGGGHIPRHSCSWGCGMLGKAHVPKELCLAQMVHLHVDHRILCCTKFM